MPDELTPARIVELSLAYRLTQVLLSAIELDVFSALAAGPLDADALRQRTGVHRRGARDFFDALVALGLLEREGDHYANTAAADHYLVRAKPTYIGAGILGGHAGIGRVWPRLTEALRSGEAQGGLAGGFAEFYADPQRRRGFLTFMTAVSVGAARVMAQKFPWAEYRTFVDVGTAQGCFPVEIARANPHLAGAGFDLTAVRPLFEEYVAAHGLAERLRFLPGDFFTDPLPQADVLVMGQVLHDWNLEQKRMLLAKAHAALPRGGALIVYEHLIDDERRTSVRGLVASVNMLLVTPGGFDYTGSDCCGWMRDTGFPESRVEPLLGGAAMVVGIK